MCEDISGPDECIDPPDAVTYGFLNRFTLQLSIRMTIGKIVWFHDKKYILEPLLQDLGWFKVSANILREFSADNTTHSSFGIGIGIGIGIVLY